MLKHIFNNEIDFNNKDYEDFIKRMLYILTNPFQKEEEFCKKTEMKGTLRALLADVLPELANTCTLSKPRTFRP